MSLRNKTLLAIGATLLGLCIALYAVASELLMESVDRAEEEQTYKVVNSVLTLIAQKRSQLASRFSDWAAWDDAYEFVSDDNDRFKQTNLVEATLANLKLDVIVFIDTSGRVVYGTGFNQADRRKTPLPDGLAGLLNRGSRLLSRDERSPELTGLVPLPGGPMVITAQAILTSEGKGPARGTLLVGRWFQASEAESIASLMDAPLSAYRLDQPDLPPDVLAARASLLQQPRAQPIVVKPLSDRETAGYALLNDIEGRPAVVMRLSAPRLVHAQGVAAGRILLWLGIAAGAVFGAVMLTFVERLVLSRVLRLSREVSSIGESRGAKGRVSVNGADELSALSRSINEMLGKIEVYEIEQEHRSADLLAAKLLAESANQTKSQFIATMSHELRTPLNAILGYGEMLQEDARDEGRERLARDLGKITSAGSHLLALVNGVLDLSQIEAQRMAITPSVFAIGGVLREVVDDVRSLSEKNGNALRLECPDDIGAMRADRTKVLQVLLNITQNAVKFTQRGEVTVAVERSSGDPGDRGPRAGGEMIVFRISDTGIGIEPDQLKRLFQPFVQADSSMSRRFGGTGLGLSLSRALCRLMSGDITVESEPGRGSIFTITLPAEIPSQSKAG